MKQSLLLIIFLSFCCNIFAQQDTIFLKCSPSCSTVDVINCDGFSVNTAIINEDCPASADGEIMLTVSGVVAPFTYAWSTGATTNNINNLAAGTYRVTISDSDDCSNIYIFDIARARSACCTVGSGCTDNDPCTTNDVLDSNCNCVGTAVDCSENLMKFACNDGFCYTQNDSIVYDACGMVCVACTGTTVPTLMLGSSCDDNNPCTTNDLIDANCNCVGTPIDCSTTGVTQIVACDDNDPCTANDVQTVLSCDNSICVPCAGTPIDCSSETVTLPCDDLDNCTSNDSITYKMCDNSICVPCAGVANNLAGTACDDGSACTINDVYNANCECEGTVTTVCDDGNENTYNDVLDTNCNCSGTPCPASPIVTANDPACYGTNDGNFTLPTNYTFLSTGTSTSIDYAAGQYTLDIEHTTGCTYVITANLSDPAGINIVCGVTDLIITGSTNYTVSWSGGETGTEIPFGTNQATVLYNGGCIDVIICTRIKDCSTLTGNLNVTDILCHGDATGAINLTPSGGYAPYSYSWSNSATSQDISGLIAGSYTVTITDDEGCQFVETIEVTEPDFLFGRCGTFNSGTVVGLSNVGGGVSPYTYNWLTPANNTHTTRLIPYDLDGIYAVTMTDANGCTLIKNCNVGCPSNPSVNVSVAFLPCSDPNPGATLITDDGTTGGTAPYTFNWSNGDVTVGNTFPDHYVPCGESHVLVIEDANGCFSSVFSENNSGCSCTDPCANISLTCTQDATNVTATVTGSNGFNSFQWSDGFSSNNGNSSSQPLPLVTTAYTVTVTDFEGCTDICSITVAGTCQGSPCNTDPCSSAGTWDAACSTCLGQVDIDTDSDGLRDCDDCAPNDPTLPATLGTACDDGDANTYNDVYVGNGCLCEGTICPTITLSFGTTDPSCLDDSDGSITVSPTAGTAPYTYAWSNSATTATIINLGVGTYTVTVTDNNGCTGTQSVTLQSEPCDVCENVDIIVNSTNLSPSCAGVPNGFLTIAPAGGTAPYTYQWSNGQTGTTLNGLKGIYSVTVTDADGCIGIEDFFIPTLPPMILEVNSIVHPSCDGETDASIDISVVGSQGENSNGTFTYTWSNGATTEDLINVGAGSYTLIVKETSYNCEQAFFFTISDPGVECCLDLQIAYNLTCATAFNNATIDITVIGGTAPINTIWDDFNTNEDRTDLQGGIRVFSIEDGAGCNKNFLIDVPCCYPVSVTRECDNAPIQGANVLVSGTILGQTNASGNFEIEECLLPTDVVTIESPEDFANGIEGSDIAAIRAHILNSTPFTLDHQFYAADANNGGSVSGFDIIQIIQETAWKSWVFYDNNNPSVGFPVTHDLEGSVSNPFVFKGFKVGDIDCDANTVLGPCQQDLELSAVITDDNGSGNGAIDITVTSGIGLLYYTWFNQQTGEYQEIQDLSGLSEGNYQIKIADGFGCSITEEYTVNSSIVCPAANEPCNDGDANTFSDLTDGNCGCAGSTCPSPTLTGALITDNSCLSAEDGQYQANEATYGTAPYTYQWSNGQTGTNVIGGLGTYNLTVTDANGCKGFLTATFTNNSACPSPCASLSLECVATATAGANTGAVDLAVNGGNAPYTYAWSNGATTTNITGIVAGEYTVTVTDEENCTATCSSVVCNSNLRAIYNFTEPSCYNSNDGELTSLTITGGTAPYTLLDENRNTIILPFSNLVGKRYKFFIVDDLGCEVPVTFSLGSPDPLRVDCGNTDLVITGGTVPYSVSWSNATTGLTIPAGNNTATVTDANGCVTTIECKADCPPLSGIFTPTDEDCGLQNGAITANLTSGAAPYTYAWSNGGTTATITGLSAGKYKVTFTDANGCKGTASKTLINNCPESLQDFYACNTTNDYIEICPDLSVCSNAFLEIKVGNESFRNFTACEQIVETDQDVCISLVVDISTSSQLYLNNQKAALTSIINKAARGELITECAEIKFSIIPHGIGAQAHCGIFGGCQSCLCTTPMTDDYNQLLQFINALYFDESRNTYSCTSGCECFKFNNNEFKAIDAAVATLNGCTNPILIYTTDGAPHERGDCNGDLGDLSGCAYDPNDYEPFFTCSRAYAATYIQNAVSGTDIDLYGVILSDQAKLKTWMNQVVNQDNIDDTNVLVIPRPDRNYDLNPIFNLIGLPQTVTLRATIPGCQSFGDTWTLDLCDPTCF